MKLTLRKIKNNPKWFTINTIGLSIAFVVALLVSLYVQNELSYDKFHKKSERIFRITGDSNEGNSSYHNARMPYSWTVGLDTDFPDIEKLVRFVPFRNAIAKADENNFNIDFAYLVDKELFEVFDIELIFGNKEELLIQPNKTIISEALALKYFGNTDVIGKEISIISKYNAEPLIYTVEAVMKDFPVNSHFHPQFLGTQDKDILENGWSFTYALLKPEANRNDLVSNIQNNWDKKAKKAGAEAPIVYAQNLEDIHLYSHKPREIEKNGDIRSIILLFSSGVIILIIAFLNYFNLSKVRYIASKEEYKVRLINGATKYDIIKESIKESVLLSLTTLILGAIISYKLISYFDYELNKDSLITVAILISIVHVLMVIFISVFPLLKTKLKSLLDDQNSNEKLRTSPLLVQFSLTIIAITATIVLNNQMNFISNQHPGGESDNMIVIPRGSNKAVEKYELFKSELLKKNSIAEITATMAEPGGHLTDNFNFEMEGIEYSETATLNIMTADSNFFRTMGFEVLAGSVDLGHTPSFDWDVKALELSRLKYYNKNQPRINELEKEIGTYSEKYILNESAIKQLGFTNPNDVIGKRFRIKYPLAELYPQGTVIAVVKDMHYTTLHEKEKPTMFVSRKLFNRTFIIKTKEGQQKEALADIKDVWESVNPDLPLEYEFISDTYKKVYSPEIAQSKLLSLFAIISVMLSTLGVLAIVIFNTQRRTKEIGVRKVNGATIKEIVVMLNQDFLKWLILSFVIATPIAWYAMNKWLENFAYKTDLSWWIFALAGITTLAITMITVSWQTFRAARKNPVEALRYE